MNVQALTHYFCPLIFQMSGKSVNTEQVQLIIKSRYPGKNVNLSESMKSCSSTGLDSNNLSSIYQVSTFFRCLFEKLQQQISKNKSDFECII